MFSSDNDAECLDTQSLLSSEMPIAVLEAVNPVMLSVRLSECYENNSSECVVTDIPSAVRQVFSEDLVFDTPKSRRVYVTLGQFSILRLERDAQLLIPIYDYCIPDKECDCKNIEENPCELFSQVDFPVNEFFPPTSAGEIDPMRIFRNDNSTENSQN